MLFSPERYIITFIR